MIRRDHLQSAILAVTAVDRDAGHGLQELFDARRIVVPPARKRRDHASGKHWFHYYFDGQRVDIPKTAFVAQGIQILEQSLVLKLGELREKQSRGTAWVSGNVRPMAEAIRRAGADLLVAHELRRLKVSPAGLDSPWWLPDPGSVGPHFGGHLADGQPARFVPLVLNREILSQVARSHFEFFDIRFLLRNWVDGSLPWIYACVIRRQVLGLVKLRVHRQAPDTRLEICYIARRMPQHHDTETPPKGVGTFLVAGTWMLWQAFYPEARRISLDGEVSARKFYLDCGFREQRLCRYVLETPRGYLLAAIADMADDGRVPAGQVRPRLEALIGSAVKALRTRGEDGHRRASLAFIHRCLMSRHQPYPATAALSLLLQYRSRIPEAPALIDSATRTGNVRITGETPDAHGTVLLVNDPRFGLHLQQVFHLESAKRLDAFNRALAHPSVTGSLKTLMIQPAERHQLLWVHTADYLDRLERTSGRQLATLDLDTQTTEHSWEVACLAVGGVFGIMDGICGGRASRGIAAVRPPGHHAEPDRAMGFCLLNNVALAARYLQMRHGVNRIMIVDLDAHHGNGTQRVFYADNSVLFVSTHRYPAYPGTGSVGEIGRGAGKGFTVNIPMDKGSGDRDFTCVLHRIIDPLARGFQPEFVLVSLGFDLYLHDRLGGMKVTPEGYGTITAMLIRIAERECQGRIAFVLEGGYSVKGIEACGLRFLQQLCAPDAGSADQVSSRHAPSLFDPAVIARVIDVHQPFWPMLA